MVAPASGTPRELNTMSSLRELADEGPSAAIDGSSLENRASNDTIET
jgi:hypothetical protein